METVAVPKASPAALPEVAAFVAPFAPLFRRGQSRASMERYVTGLLTDLPRKNCDAIAAAVAGTSTERLQHLLTDADWEADALDRERVRALVGLSPPGGVLVLDDTGLPKQGKTSVGVSRQYSGTLGKIGNCQVVVSAEYAADEPGSTAPLHWPVGARLYLPEPWADDAARRERAHVPADVAFRTKPELALALLDRAREWGVPFGVVVTDAGYGGIPAFLDGLDEREVRYVTGVERGFGVRLPGEVVEADAAPLPPYAGTGRPRVRRPAPLHTAEAVVAVLPEEAWRTVAWREGTKGDLRKQFVAVRAHRATGNPFGGRSVDPPRLRTAPAGWLLAERPAPGEDGERKWYYAALPADTPLRRLVQLAHARWVVEQFYEEAKGECGLDHHQGRRWDSLHRHLALAMLAYSFLVVARRSTPADGGLSPLTPRADVAGRPPMRPRLAAAGPRPLVHRDRPGRPLPPAEELTKQY
jgi:SRSO17 transposase